MHQTEKQFVLPVTDVKASADTTAETTSQALYGESVKVLETNKHWSFIRNQRDDYEGYVDSRSTGPKSHISTHWVATRATLVFAEPDIKSRLLLRLGFGAEVSLSNEPVVAKHFRQTVDGSFAWHAHYLPTNTVMTDDFVDIARAHFIHAPYLWGGRTSDGLDCSALVQLACFAAGTMLPRDSGEQEKHINNSIGQHERKRNDLVYWPGHVALLVDKHTVLHATAHHLCCVIEPLAAIIQRAGEVSSIQRLIAGTEPSAS
ncbi:MAG: NlpC/P60 family protein [Granulosicoccus sp.]